jgi:hypothetical protein
MFSEHSTRSTPLSSSMELLVYCGLMIPVNSPLQLRATVQDWKEMREKGTARGVLLVNIFGTFTLVCTKVSVMVGRRQAKNSLSFWRAVAWPLASFPTFRCPRLSHEADLIRILCNIFWFIVSWLYSIFSWRTWRAKTGVYLIEFLLLLI